MSSVKPPERNPTQPPQPPRWKGADALELVYKLNERAFTLLKDGATQHGELWSRFGARALKRAARFPFVILDVHFTHEPWWRSVSAEQRPVDTRPGTLLWSPEVAEKLMGELLVLAWHTAKWDRCIARLSLGMIPTVVEAIAALTPQQLDVVPARHCGALRLRWQENVDFWTRLLSAAEANEGALSDTHLHAKLLFLGELMAGSRPVVAPA